LHFSNGDIWSFAGFDTFTGYMDGGTVMGIGLQGSSTLYLSGGNITGYIAIRENAVLHVFGKDFAFTPITSYNGWLSGLWADDTSFTIYLREFPPPFPGSGVVLHTVPEPCTLGLCAFGFLLMRRTAPTILG
jgi:hypothetical protein